MSIIVKRLGVGGKGLALTSSEIDANVSNLNNDKVERNNPTFKAAPSLVNNLIPLTGTVLPAINPSLNLDFANGKQLDPRITFSRNTVATYCDGKTTKLAEQNLLSYSQLFSSSTWWSTNGTTLSTNAIPAPDGTITSFTVNEGATFGYHDLESASAFITIAANTSYTLSVHVKYIDRQYFMLALSGSAHASACFDLINGTRVSSSSIGIMSIISSDITPVGGGWYRCFITVSSTASNSLTLRFAPSNTTVISSFGLPAQYQGTNKSLNIWGAQFEQRAFASTYLPTTNTAITNYVSAIIAAPAGVPRLDYDPVTKKPLGLLIEELRTNSLLNSTIDGVNLATQSITTTAVTRTLSFYGTGKVVLSGTATATITGLGAYPTRTTYTYTPTAGTLTLTVSGTVQYANDEVGSFATSYIPTAGTEKSRTADQVIMIGVNFSSWYNQSEGSFFIAYNGGRESTSNGYGRVLASNLGDSFIGSNNSKNNISSYNGTINTTLTVTNADFWGVGGKAAMSYSPTSTIVSGNGVSTTNNTLPTWSTKLPLSLNIGRSPEMNGHVSKILYYPKALTSQELQGLTS